MDGRFGYGLIIRLVLIKMLFVNLIYSLGNYDMEIWNFIKIFSRRICILGFLKEKFFEFIIMLNVFCCMFL